MATAMLDHTWQCGRCGTRYRARADDQGLLADRIYWHFRLAHAGLPAWQWTGRYFLQGFSKEE